MYRTVPSRGAPASASPLRTLQHSRCSRDRGFDHLDRSVLSKGLQVTVCGGRRSFTADASQVLRCSIAAETRVKVCGECEFVRWASSKLLHQPAAVVTVAQASTPAAKSAALESAARVSARGPTPMARLAARCNADHPFELAESLVIEVTLVGCLGLAKVICPPPSVWAASAAAATSVASACHSSAALGCAGSSSAAHAWASASRSAGRLFPSTLEFAPSSRAG